MNAPDTFIGSPVVLPRWFEAEACRAWVEAGEAAGLSPAGLVVPRENYREAEVGWIPEHTAPGSLRQRLWDAVELANRWYGFDLEQFEPSLQYTRYGEGGHAGWHADCGMGATASRKLALSVQLSDPAEYGGGSLEFLPGGRPALAGNRGCVVAFPAVLAHRVTPITRGTRRALVAWVHGPPFR